MVLGFCFYYFFLSKEEGKNRQWVQLLVSTGLGFGVGGERVSVEAVGSRVGGPGHCSFCCTWVKTPVLKSIPLLSVECIYS